MARTKEEEKWKRESDARTLSEAEVIKSDKKRLKEAVKAAKEMIANQKEETVALNKIANIKIGPKVNKSSKDKK